MCKNSCGCTSEADQECKVLIPIASLTNVYRELLLSSAHLTMQGFEGASASTRACSFKGLIWLLAFIRTSCILKKGVLSLGIKRLQIYTRGLQIYTERLC